MSGVLGRIFGGLASQASTIIDEVVTTQEEKLELKMKLEQLIMDAELAADQEITKRWEVDMVNGNWLSKSIRPLTLAFLVVATVLLVFIDAGAINFEVKEHWVNLLELVLITVIGAYFGGRSYEKSRIIVNDTRSRKEERHERRNKKLSED